MYIFSHKNISRFYFYTFVTYIIIRIVNMLFCFEFSMPDFKFLDPELYNQLVNRMADFLRAYHGEKDLMCQGGVPGSEFPGLPGYFTMDNSSSNSPPPSSNTPPPPDSPGTVEARSEARGIRHTRPDFNCTTIGSDRNTITGPLDRLPLYVKLNKDIPNMSRAELEHHLLCLETDRTRIQIAVSDDHLKD